MKHVLQIIAGTLEIVAGVLATVIAGLLVYSYYLLRKSAKNTKDYGDQIYTR